VKKKKRLIWQLFPSYLLLIIISLGAITLYATSSLRDFFLEQTASDLEARAHLIKKQIIKDLRPLNENAVNVLCQSSGEISSTRITIILPSGRVIGDSSRDPGSMESHADRPEFLQALRRGLGRSIRYSRTLGQQMMYVGIALKNKSGIIGVVRTSLSLTPIDEAIRSIQNKIVIAGIFVAIIAVFLSLLTSRLISRPIEEIQRGAECFARGDLECRLPVYRSQELGSLSETMNQMAGELQERIGTIRRQRNQIEATLSSMAEGVIGVDMNEDVLNMNKAAARMFGFDPRETEGRSIQELIRNTEIQRFVSYALASGKAVEKDIVLYSDSDGERFLSLRGTLLQDADGQKIGALIVLNDISRLQRLEKIRRDFVANVSHEIKTPITAIKGFVETLRDGATQDEREMEHFLGIIGKHVDRLEAIIEDLLSLSQIEQVTEKDEVALSEGSIREVLLMVIRSWEVRAAEKDIRLELFCDESLKAGINTVLLEQAVANLVENSIKYSDSKSRISIEANQKDEEIQIAVRDHGCGIGKEHLSRVFERFYRVDKARSRKMGGTGLGLSIVKHIAQAHKGYVSVESSVGKGSTFSIHLPKA